jgi:hypothetical protein
MIPAPAGSEPGGFELGPEIWLLLLGVLATLVVFSIFVWLIRQQLQQEKSLTESEASSGSKKTIDHD